MRTVIDLPESTYHKGEQAARAQGVTIEVFILRAVERELDIDLPSASPFKRVNSPLLPSKEPGSIDLKDFNFDDLLA